MVKLKMGYGNLDNLEHNIDDFNYFHSYYVKFYDDFFHLFSILFSNKFHLHRFICYGLNIYSSYHILPSNIP